MSGGGDTPTKTLWKLELIDSWCYGEYKDGNAFVTGPDENNIYDTNEQGVILKTEELAFVQTYMKDLLSEYFSDIQTVSVVIQTGLSVGDDVPNWDSYETLG